MGINISASSLNLNASQYQVGSYNTTVASSQEEEDTEKTSSMMTRKLKEMESESSDGTSVTETSTEGDTLSLSQEGLSMSSGSTATTTSSSTSSSTSSDLSGYSESQLKSMLENGEISQAEYNKEMRSRATEDTGVTDTTTQSVQNDKALVSQLNILA